MIELLGSVWIASVVGSPHCAGMCGPFVILAGGSAKRQAAYHAGRLVTYASLGAAAGAVGAAIDLGGSALGMRRLALALAGLVLVAQGAAVLARLAGLGVPRFDAPAWLGGLHARAARALPGRRPALRCFVLGALSTLLPCGWLYAFVATAAGTGAALFGALALVLFWAGTVPALAMVGLGVGLFRPLGRRAPAVAALALIAVGLVALSSGTRLAQARGPETGTPGASHAACVEGSR